jgi:hypothetical protein
MTQHHGGSFDFSADVEEGDMEQSAPMRSLPATFQVQSMPTVSKFTNAHVIVGLRRY